MMRIVCLLPLFNSRKNYSFTRSFPRCFDNSTKTVGDYDLDIH